MEQLMLFQVSNLHTSYIWLLWFNDCKDNQIITNITNTNMYVALLLNIMYRK